MKESRLAGLVIPLHEMIHKSDQLLSDYRTIRNVRLAAMTHDFIPHELLAAWDIIPVRIPWRCRSGHTFHDAVRNGKEVLPYDMYIVPGNEGYPERPDIFHYIYPGGFGDEAVPGLQDIMERLLSGFDLPQEKPDSMRLRYVAEEYDRMRRLLRGITSNRAIRPSLLSQQDLCALFEAASIFPPALMLDHLQGILDAMNSEQCQESDDMPRAMLYATGVYDPVLLDAVEETGILIGEDDTDDGRRQFDMSVNPASACVYDELLDCLTYRPLPPPVRPLAERYELLYRMIKNYGIEMVIFISDWCSGPRMDDIDVLRRRLMRSGVDPLVIDSVNVLSSVSDYARKMKMQGPTFISTGL